MAWRNLPQLAGLLSQYYHAGQLDKAGKKYWKHPKRVAKLVQEFPGFARFSPHEQEVAVCAAFLHDVIEDCDVSPQDLTAHGFSPDIVQTVMLVSKNIETPAGGYLERIAADPIARAVKVSEVADNSSHKRQARLVEQGVEFNFDKYPQALRQLSLTPAEEEWFESVR
jgi:(p)ppGpp synthase/HD superfamily hydrolase